MGATYGKERRPGGVRVGMGRSALVVAVLLAAVAAAPARASDHAVAFPTGSAPASYAYAPADVAAAAGDTVTFGGPFTYHPLVWDEGDFATTDTGTTATFAFPRPGLYAFHCAIHASMHGTVRIPGNRFATPDFTAAPAAPGVGQTVTFTTAPVADPDGTIARWEWDLDGDGSFETTTPTGQATRAYGAAGTVTVRVRYVDDGHEASPATAHDLVVRADGPGGPGTPAPGGGPAPGGLDVTPPAVRPASRVLRVRRRVAALRVVLGEPARITVALRSRGTVLARGEGSPRAGTAALRLRLTGAGAARLRRSARVRAALTLVARDAAGNARTVRATVTLRRSG